jgi:hypothetical protein
MRSCFMQEECSMGTIVDQAADLQMGHPCSSARSAPSTARPLRFSQAGGGSLYRRQWGYRHEVK